MLTTERTIRMIDGVELFVRQYRPTGAPASRTILVVHGLCEYGGRYEHLARPAVERGWNVIVPDQRGHGRSGGVPMYVNRFSDFLDDLDALRRELRLDSASLALVAHSHGGLISIRYLQTRPDVAAAAVLCSPLLGLLVRVPTVKMLAGRLLEKVCPTIRFRTNVNPLDLSHDREYLARRKSDPQIHRFITIGWFVQAEQAMQQAHAAAASLTAPLLILQGTDDRVVDPLATQRFAESVSSPDKSLVMLSDHLHELFFEPDSAATVQRILDWLESRVPRR
jgi:lysophospholipase